IGLIAALVAGRRGWPPFSEQRVRQTAWGLLAFALILAAGMTLGAKKFDRYLLPAFPALDIIAALGWVAVSGRAQAWRRKVTAPAAASPLDPASLLRPRPLALALVGLFLLHGLLGLLHYPYYLTYFNPLLGGGRTAPQMLMVGWGEGLDETARWLNRQPDADQLRVTAWYADGPFSYFFHGQAIEPSFSSPLFWLDNDFVVLYVNQWQRQLPSPEIVNYFMAQTPVYQVRAGGMELARVYDLRTLTPPDFAGVGRESAADFGGQIRLSGVEGLPATVQPGEEVALTLYLQSLAPMTVNYNILVRLLGQDGTELWRQEGWPWGAPTSDWPLRTIRPDGHTFTVPATAPPGLYQLAIGFYDPASFEPLPVTAHNGHTVLDPTRWEVALLHVGEPPALAAPLDPPWRFGDAFLLRGAVLPAVAQPGTNLPLHLDWASIKNSGRDYTTFVHVVNRDGVTVTQQDEPPLAGFAPTRLWSPTLQLSEDRQIPLPADLPPGEYTVRLGLYTLEAGRLPVSHADQPAGDFVPLGS
ncbi:MAG TPA: hypothetical protein PKE45_24270, partial [Caldilineaceae bacterium]|nr:hypothetical protein [Caldilineaceae bacterium]